MVLADAPARGAGSPGSRPSASRHPERPRDPERRRDPGPRRRETGAAAWTRVALTAGAMLAALFGLHPLLRGVSWWFFGAALVLVVLGVSAVVRARFGRGPLPAAVGGIVGLLVLVPAFAADTAIAGIVPTTETWDALQSVIRSGLISIQEQSTPAEPVPGILLILLGPLVLLTVLADLAVLEARTPALAAIPLLALLAVPIAVQEGIGDAYAWLVVLACYLALLRSRLPAAPRSLIVATAALVGLGSLAIPLFLPSTTSQQVVTPLGYGVRVNPIIDLGADLRQGASVQVLTYASTRSVQPYLRLVTLTDFRDDVWAPNDSQRGTTTFQSIPMPPGLDDDIPLVQREIDVHVDRIGGRWLPMPFAITRVTGAVGDWRVHPDALTVTSDYLSSDGQTYTVDYATPNPTRAQLKASGFTEPTDMGPELAVPRGIDPVVAKTAESVTKGLGSNWERAVALQAYFRGFTYSTQAPVDGGYDGSSISVLPRFLQTRSGYCVHFASAMAIMARQLGIPSRVVVGYLPGTDSGTTDDAGKRTHTYTVNSRQLHAWPELYFPGVGWTRFEPTPTLGDVPGYSLAASDSSTSDDPSDAASASASAAATPQPTTSARTDLPDEQSQASTGSSASTIAATAFGWAGAVLALILLLLVPAGLRLALRFTRFSRLDGRDAGAAAWAELRDTAVDAGWRAPPTETARDFAERLIVALPAEGDAIRRLRDAVESDSYARWRGAGIEPEDLREVVRALARTAEGRDRIRALLLPPSLVERVRALAPG